MNTEPSCCETQDPWRLGPAVPCPARTYTQTYPTPYIHTRPGTQGHHLFIPVTWSWEDGPRCPKTCSSDPTVPAPGSRFWRVGGSGKPRSPRLRCHPAGSRGFLYCPVGTVIHSAPWEDTQAPLAHPFLLLGGSSQQGLDLAPPPGHWLGLCGGEAPAFPDIIPLSPSPSRPGLTCTRMPSSLL